MYVSRKALEEGLVESLDSDQISLLIGGSGSGKSWLYKRFFEGRDITYSVITVPRSYASSFHKLIEKELGNLNVNKPTKTRTHVNAGGGILRGGREIEDTIRDQDALLLLARQLRKIAKKRPAYIVIENAEQGLSDKTGDYLNDIANIVLSGNSDDIKRERVKILIVSADDALRTGLSKMTNSEPVMRRLRKLGEVSSFSDDEARGFLKRGFIEKLRFKIADMGELLLACKDATDLRPDFMHEFCFLLAKAAEDRENVVDDPAIATAFEHWADSKLKSYLERIIEFMNMRDTRKRVRDKILYVLGRSPADAYTTQNVLQVIKQEFPTIEFQTNEITRELNILCAASGNSAPLLRKSGSDKNPLYGFVGTSERLATAFALGRRGDEIYRKH